jgi:putative ABC transport system permease protein
MLVACANVAAVRMANARERASEIAARLFLGATRRRLVTELAFESAPLVLVAAGLSVALWVGLITLLSSVSAIAESGVTLADHRAVAIVVIALLAGASWVLAGALPAWSASRQPVRNAQHSSSRVVWRTSRIGAPLLLGQAALAITVVAIAGAALQTFARLSRIDLGFATTGVTLVDINSPGWKYPTAADNRRLVDQLQASLRQLPAVQHVAAVSVRPFRFGEIADGLPVRRAADTLLQPDEATGASGVVVTPDYFAALGQPLIAGRTFSGSDRSDSETVIMLSRTLARALFGAQPAVGQRVDTFTLTEKWRGRLVVGIVGDAQYRGLERPSMELYVPHTQAATELGSLVVASNASGGLSDAVIRQALRRVEPEIAIERIQTTAELHNSVLSPARLLTTLVSLLGGAGLLLLALGIFGAAAAALRAAWPEIAVRQAVGAMPFQAARAPLRTLTRALLIGMVAGLAVTPLALSAAEGLGLAAAGTLAQSLATGVVAVSLAAVAATAPSIWRASRSSPAELLRER